MQTKKQRTRKPIRGKLVWTTRGIPGVTFTKTPDGNVVLWASLECKTHHSIAKGGVKSVNSTQDI